MALLNTSEWMSYIDGAKLISEFTIPGTHDSCSFKPSGFKNFAGYTKTQSHSIYEQLCLGCRFLDIRGRAYKDKLVMHHGMVYLELNFDDIIDVCKRFLTENPSETILMSLKPEYDEYNCNKKYAEIFYSYYDQDPSLWYLENRIPTLEAVRGKIVLFRRFGTEGVSTPVGIDLYMNGDFTDHPIESNQFLHVEDRDDVTDGGVDSKIEAIETNITAAENNNSSNNLYLTFASGYAWAPPNPSPSPYAHTAVNLDPNELASRVNPWLIDRLSQINGKNKGIIAVDFLDPQLSECLVEQNINDLVSFNQKWYVRNFWSEKECYSLEDEDYHYVDTNENCAPRTM